MIGTILAFPLYACAVVCMIGFIICATFRDDDETVSDQVQQCGSMAILMWLFIVLGRLVQMIP